MKKKFLLGALIVFASSTVVYAIDAYWRYYFLNKSAEFTLIGEFGWAEDAMDAYYAYGCP